MCSSNVVNRFASTGKLLALALAVVVEALVELLEEAPAAIDEVDGTTGVLAATSDAVEADATEVEADCPAVLDADVAAVDVAAPLDVLALVDATAEEDVEGSRLRT